MRHSTADQLPSPRLPGWSMPPLVHARREEYRLCPPIPFQQAPPGTPEAACNRFCCAVASIRIDGSRRIPLSALEEYVARLLAERKAA